jgi:hypothetical protein
MPDGVDADEVGGFIDREVEVMACARQQETAHRGRVVGQVGARSAERERAISRWNRSGDSSAHQSLMRSAWRVAEGENSTR